MTKITAKHYNKIAEITRHKLVCGYVQGLGGAIHSRQCRKCTYLNALSEYFQSQDATFKRDLFLSQCGCTDQDSLNGLEVEE